MGFDFQNFLESLQYGIKYLPNTLKLTFIPILVGLIFGSVIAIIRVYKVPFFGKLFGVLIAIYQGIPIVVALLIYNLIFMTQFDKLNEVLHLNINIAKVDSIWVGIIALSMSAICWMEESIKGAFLSVDKGQYEAGYSVGLTKIQAVKRIVLPQVIPVAVPMLTNNIVGTIKGSSVAMAIGITEVLAGSEIPCSKTYSFLEGYVAAAVIYWIFTIIVENIAKILEIRGDKFRRKLA